MLDENRILETFDAAQSRSLGEHYLRLANALLARADRLEAPEKAREQRRRERESMEQLWTLVETYRAAGQSFDQAIAAVTRQSGFDEELVRAWWRHADKRNGEHKRNMRRRYRHPGALLRQPRDGIHPPALRPPRLLRRPRRPGLTPAPTHPATLPLNPFPPCGGR